MKYNLIKLVNSLPYELQNKIFFYLTLHPVAIIFKEERDQCVDFITTHSSMYWSIVYYYRNYYKIKIQKDNFKKPLITMRKIFDFYNIQKEL